MDFRVANAGPVTQTLPCKSTKRWKISHQKATSPIRLHKNPFLGILRPPLPFAVQTKERSKKRRESPWLPRFPSTDRDVSRLSIFVITCMRKRGKELQRSVWPISSRCLPPAGTPQRVQRCFWATPFEGQKGRGGGQVGGGRCRRGGGGFVA